MNDHQWNQLVHLEEAFFNRGQLQGIQDGANSGHLDGFQSGLSNGFTVLMEIQYYHQSATTWLDLARSFNLTPSSPASATSPGCFPFRSLRFLTSFLTLIASFPTHNHLDTEFSSLLTLIRSKWKLICSVVGVPIHLASFYSNGLDSVNAWSRIGSTADTPKLSAAKRSSLDY